MALTSGRITARGLVGVLAFAVLCFFVGRVLGASTLLTLFLTMPAAAVVAFLVLTARSRQRAEEREAAFAADLFRDHGTPAPEPPPEESELSPEIESRLFEAATETVSTPPPPPPLPSVDLPRRLEEISSRAGDDLPGALAEAESLRESFPASAGMLATLGGLLLRSGEVERGRTLIAEGIERGVRTGAGAMAVEAWTRAGEGRHALALGPSTLRPLARALASRGHWEDARRCLERAAADGAAPTEIARDLVAVASEARGRGAPAEAVTTLELAERLAPPELVPFVEDELRTVRRRLERGT